MKNEFPGFPHERAMRLSRLKQRQRRHEEEAAAAPERPAAPVVEVRVTVPASSYDEVIARKAKAESPPKARKRGDDED